MLYDYWLLQNYLNHRRSLDLDFFTWEFLLENEEFLRIEFVYYNNQRKTLGKRKQYLGVFIDSLKDFDIYFLIRKSKFTVKKLLYFVEEKFGVTFDEGMFRSEGFKGLSFLKNVIFIG